MKKGLKVVLLSIILILPVLIYLFLRTFGENRYDLPVYPQAAVEITGCGVFEPSYRVTQLPCDHADPITLTGHDYLLHFPATDRENRTKEGNEIRRFLQKTSQYSFTLVTFAAKPDSTYWHNLKGLAKDGGPEWTVSSRCEDVVDQIQRCTLLSSLADVKSGAPAGRLVLLDKEGSIRGYYVPSDKEEIDRLIIELDILKPGIVEK